jgi:hypothetical protein
MTPATRLTSIATILLGLLGAIPAASSASHASDGGAAADAAGKLISDARSSFARVTDYVCLLYRTERVGGTLLPEQTIQLRVRQKPFSVGMKWLGPAKLAGQEAVFVTGKNNNQMRGKSAGALLGAIGFLSFDPRDPRIMAGNRHPITEAGIGVLLEQLASGHAAERAGPPEETIYQFAEYRFLNRPVTRLETIHPTNNGRHYCHRSVVYFDRETRLPVRFEAYDWPTPGAPAGGELLECYSYVDLKFNVGLTDASFGF